MVIKIRQWKKGSKENREAWIKKELNEVDNFEESIRGALNELSKEHSNSEDFKVYSQVVEYIERLKIDNSTSS